MSCAARQVTAAALGAPHVSLINHDDGRSALLVFYWDGSATFLCINLFYGILLADHGQLRS